MTCMTCKYAEYPRDEKGQITLGQPIRICKRLPPIPIWIPAPGGQALSSAWPSVPLQASCGEYAPGTSAVDVIPDKAVMS